MDGAKLTALFEYDDEQTAKNVNNFFKAFKRISRMAGEDPSALKSPVITDTPVSHDGGNHNEDKLVEHINATDLAPKIMSDVRFALNHISQRSKMIILGVYVDELSQVIMAEKLQCCKSSYKIYKKVALNEFADSLSSKKTILQLDLHKENGKELV
ncbi:ArpU family phage packaging/lysis transcriptional regulator [Ligilactobacillus cholophilus]|uniref:ArpU family phage packaging/lysis transcriptional regulator n=1 Tax=Ligilactobacillus cholophilus TaxID=3050131 RepID=UPI0025AF4F13|nr:ArpU family phage packaging/lysis transcriptional regulator [Ligilactobacillus cholophilus]